MSKPVKVGLIGYGSGGRIFHAPFIAQVPSLELVKIRETKPDPIAVARKKFPQAVIVANTSEILEDPSIELVVVTTPNHFHYTLAKAALEAGKHVVVDKPFTLTVKEANELIALAEQQQRIVTVYQNRRWDSDFKTIQKIVAGKLLGDLVEYEAHFDRFRNYVAPNTWKEEAVPGTGILYDLGAHMIDQALVLFGLPEKVHAHLATQRANALIVDNFQLTLLYPRLRVLIKAGMLVREPGPRYVLSGTEGSFVKYGLDVQEEFLKAGKFPSEVPNWGEEPESIWGKINTNYGGLHWTGKIESEKGNYTDFYTAVAKAVRGEGEVPVKPESARDVIKVIELAMRSHAEDAVLPFH